MGNFQCNHIKRPLVIGYYPIRAKGQILRLLCEYLHLEYKDLFLDPDEWQKYKKNEAKDWIVKEMPFLVDGDFHVTGAGAICYIVEKSGRVDMFGKTIEDLIKMYTFRNKKDVLSGILGLNVNLMSSDPQQQKKKMNFYWNEKIKPVLLSLQKDAMPNNFYFGYITIIDFVIYEMLGQMQQKFKQQIQSLVKLKAIREKVSQIPEIFKYEQSQRKVKMVNPGDYLNQFKSQMCQETTNNSVCNSSCMDIE